jgi:hypothetical protein
MYRAAQVNTEGSQQFAIYAAPNVKFVQYFCFFLYKNYVL